MFKPLPFFIGLRLTRAKRSNHFVSFISGISTIGLILGVMVLIIVLSVMNGFDQELRERILGMVPHATIMGDNQGLENWQKLKETVDAFKGIEQSSPFVELEGMLASKGLASGVLIYGVSPKFEKNTSIINNHIRNGTLASLKSGEYGIILGSIVASRLKVQVGDSVMMILPEVSVSVAGILPRIKRFKVVGTFSVGADLDASLAYTHIDDAAKFGRITTGVQGLRLKMTDLFQAPKLAWEVAKSLGQNYYINDWTKSHGRLFQAIQMEKSMVGLLLTLIIAVAAFNIVATLVMVVTDKQADIAILKTYGATPATIMMIFVVQGSLIGILGTSFGIILGIIGALNVPVIVTWIEQIFNVHFLSPDVYFISYLPSKLIWSDVIKIGSASLTLSLLATIYPAWRAAKVRPVEALRYE